MFTIGGYTEAELDQMKLAQGNPTAGAIANLKVVSGRLGSAVAVDATEQQAISNQMSMGARPSRGGQTPVEEIRQAKLADFQRSDGAKIPAAIVHERAAAVEQARAEVAKLLGNMVVDGDAAQEIRNSRLLDQARTRLGDDANIAQVLAELDGHAGKRNELGLVAEDQRAAHPEHAHLIDQHLSRLDPELAAAQANLRNEEQDFTIVRTAAAAVEKGIKTGNAPSPEFFDRIAGAVKRA